MHLEYVKFKKKIECAHYTRVYHMSELGNSLSLYELIQRFVRVLYVLFSAHCVRK